MIVNLCKWIEFYFFYKYFLLSCAEFSSFRLVEKNEIIFIIILNVHGQSEKLKGCALVNWIVIMKFEIITLFLCLYFMCASICSMVFRKSLLLIVFKWSLARNLLQFLLGFCFYCAQQIVWRISLFRCKLFEFVCNLLTFIRVIVFDWTAEYFFYVNIGLVGRRENLIWILLCRI